MPEDRQILRALARIGHRTAPVRPGLALALGVQPDELIAPLADLERAGRIEQWEDAKGLVRITLLGRAGGRRVRRRRRRVVVQLETDLGRPLETFADPRAAEPGREEEPAGGNGRVAWGRNGRAVGGGRDPWPPCGWRDVVGAWWWCWALSAAAGCSVYRRHDGIA